MEKIIENNILIAEFLGGSVEIWEARDRLGEDTENDAYYVYFPNFIGGIAIEDLDYHENWNSLMEVVEKIINLKNVYTQERQKVSKSINPKIEMTYKACVEFIKSYNLNESK